MSGRHNWYWFTGVGVTSFCTGAFWAKLTGPSPQIGGFLPWLTGEPDNIGTILGAVIAGSLSALVAWLIVQRTVEPVWRQFDLQALKDASEKLRQLRVESRLGFESHSSSLMLENALTLMILTNPQAAVGACEIFERSNREAEVLSEEASLQYVRSTEDFVARNDVWPHLRFLTGEYSDILQMLQSGAVGDAIIRTQRAAGIVGDARPRIERWQKVVRDEEAEIEDMIKTAQENIRSRYQK